MNGEVISFFENFICIADECPDNCCRAWDMPVDTETLEKYRETEGWEGIKCRMTLTRNREGDMVLRTPFGKCCNLSRNGLCKLHAAGKMELMPKICRLYPRNTVAYGDYHYGTLDLSCISAAIIFVRHDGRAEYVEAPEDMPIYWNIEDVYEEFVHDLREDLDKVLDYLWGSDESLWVIERDIFAHVYGMHQFLVKDEAEGARCVSFDVDEIRELCSDNLPWILEMRSPAKKDGNTDEDDIEEDEDKIIEEDYDKVIEKDEDKRIEKHVDDIYPFYPMSFVNELIYQNLPEAYLATYHPKINRLIKSYKKQFGKVTESYADDFFLDRWNGICEKYRWIEKKLKSYFSYKLQMNYLNAAIDYYVLEPVLLAMINVQFLMMWAIIEDGEDKTMTLDHFAELIAENERLISHNKVFNADVMAKVRSDLFFRE